MTTFINMFAAAGSGRNGANHRFNKGIIEHKVIMKLGMVSGDKSLLRLAFGQVGGTHEEIIQQLAKETDSGNELDQVVENLRSNHGEEFGEISGDVWNVLIHKSENDAYDKIKMVPKGQGVVAYGVLHRWFADVSGLGLAEQGRMLMHPTPPKREEELAEHVEMWQDKMRRLQAHGDEYKLAPVFKINAVRMFMIGKAK